MNLIQFADTTGKEIAIEYHPKTDDESASYTAHFHAAEVKIDGALCLLFGRGATVEEAMDDYIQCIAGKTIVFNTLVGKRTEAIVPSNLNKEGEVKMNQEGMQKLAVEIEDINVLDGCVPEEVFISDKELEVVLNDNPLVPQLVFEVMAAIAKAHPKDVKMKIASAGSYVAIIAQF